MVSAPNTAKTYAVKDSRSAPGKRAHVLIQNDRPSPCIVFLPVAQDENLVLPVFERNNGHADRCEEDKPKRGRVGHVPDPVYARPHAKRRHLLGP